MNDKSMKLAQRVLEPFPRMSLKGLAPNTGVQCDGIIKSHKKHIKVNKRNGKLGVTGVY